MKFLVIIYKKFCLFNYKFIHTLVTNINYILSILLKYNLFNTNKTIILKIFNIKNITRYIKRLVYVSKRVQIK